MGKKKVENHSGPETSSGRLDNGLLGGTRAVKRGKGGEEEAFWKFSKGKRAMPQPFFRGRHVEKFATKKGEAFGNLLQKLLWRGIN